MTRIDFLIFRKEVFATPWAVQHAVSVALVQLQEQQPRAQLTYPATSLVSCSLSGILSTILFKLPETPQRVVDGRRSNGQRIQGRQAPRARILGSG